MWVSVSVSVIASVCLILPLRVRLLDGFFKTWKSILFRHGSRFGLDLVVWGFLGLVGSFASIRG